MVDRKYTEILIENFESQNKAILEAVGQMQDQVKHIPAIRDDLTEVKQDVKTIKHAVTETNRDLNHLEKRVTRLEKARV